MKLSIQHVEVLIHYAYCTGDVSGAFMPQSRAYDAVQCLLTTGMLELQPDFRDRKIVSRADTRAQYVLSDDGRALVDQILRDSVDKPPSSQHELDADFEKWIVGKHGDHPGRKHPLKEVYATEHAAYMQGRLDEQK